MPLILQWNSNVNRLTLLEREQVAKALREGEIEISLSGDRTLILDDQQDALWLRIPSEALPVLVGDIREVADADPPRPPPRDDDDDDEGGR